MTLFICMYVHGIGYRQMSVSVVMAPEPHSKSSFNLFLVHILVIPGKRAVAGAPRNIYSQIQFFHIGSESHTQVI